jgi:lysophospholipase L1-like esterase
MKKELGPIPFGVILLPNLHHLYPVRFQKYLTHKGMSLENRDASQPYETIRSTLKERQIIIVEVLDGLRETGDPQLMFYNDAHFNAKGHKVIARIVSNWVRTR